MKILIVRTYPSYMDIERNTYNIQEVGLAKALVRKGNICDIVFWTNKPEKAIDIPVDECGNIKVFFRRGKTVLKNTIYINCYDLFEQYDILQTAEYNQIESWILAKRYPKKTIIYHGPYYSPFNKRYNLMCSIFDKIFLKRYIKLGSQFIVKSKLAKDFLAKKGIVNSKVVGVGFDPEQMQSNNLLQTDFTRQIVTLKENGNKIILYIGRIELRRNILFLIDVFKGLVDMNNHIKLVIIGNGPTEYCKSCRDKIVQYEIKDKIIYTDRMEQKYLPSIYKLADIFLLPTLYEIFGMVILEAMYFGAPVLTTLNGGSDILIENNKSGYILPELNVDNWCKRIMDILEKDNSELKMRANLKIANEFTWDALVDKFTEAYNHRLEN